MKKGHLNYGEASNDSLELARQNFPESPIMVLSYCTTPIELLSNDGKDTIVGTATGFFWVKDGHPYLVTNYHVISGRNPLTGNIMSKELYVPRKIAYYGTSIRQEAGDVIFSRKRWVLAFSDEIDMDAVLAQAPIVNGNPVDVWAFPLAPNTILLKDPARSGFHQSELLSCAINQNTSTITGIKAGDDCFALGYPIQNYAGLMPPIWKRGSIASDTAIGVDGKPAFLVDAATTKSMSGSPIICKSTDIITDIANRRIGHKTNYGIIGIYGGRLQRKDLEDTQIGYGWYKTVIDPVIDFYNYSYPSDQKN